VVSVSTGRWNQSLPADVHGSQEHFTKCTCRRTSAIHPTVRRVAVSYCPLGEPRSSPRSRVEGLSCAWGFPRPGQRFEQLLHPVGLKWLYRSSLSGSKRRITPLSSYALPCHSPFQTIGLPSVVYHLRRPWPNASGANCLVLQPTDFLRRLAALVPVPYANFVRYHGVFAGRSRWRDRLPEPPSKRTDEVDAAQSQPENRSVEPAGARQAPSPQRVGVGKDAGAGRDGEPRRSRSRRVGDRAHS